MNVTKKDKRTTGVTGLDHPLDGGFPIGARIVFYGPPLSGLDLMARQFWQVEEGKSTYFMLDAEVEPGMLDATGMDLEELVASMSGNRVVVDSLSALIVNHGFDAAYAFVTKDTLEVLGRGANILYTLYPGLHPAWDEIRLMRAADVVITLREALHGNEFERTLSVQKMKGGQVPQRAIPYHFIPKGVELSTTSRVI
jgi:KaiC/GvpD/RAD55 family RecA-like ATPase